MASCMLCKKDVTTGFVICGDCARSLETFTLPPELVYFIDQLAENIVADQKIYPCHMCSISKCSAQTSDITCQNGIKAWLLSKADQFFDTETVCLKEDDCNAQF